MADNAREQERSELYKTIWKMACDFVHGGSVSPNDFKQYVFGTMFYRFLSESLDTYVTQQEIEAGAESDFRYANLSDEEAEGARDELLAEKGFFIKPSELFCNVQAKAQNDLDFKNELNVKLEGIFKNIEDSSRGTPSEGNFKGLFKDFNVQSESLGKTQPKQCEMLQKLLDGVASMNLSYDGKSTIDAFGDAYEYLMGMYASSAGKKGGEFYTPMEVSELLTKLATVGKTEVNKVYDPACGSGSLLLKANRILGKDNVKGGFYGQEINITTYNLCRMNMFLHDIGYDKFNIANDDTLLVPSKEHLAEEPFEVIVSNPPYSISWKGEDDPTLINDPRFSPAGVLAPKSKADFAFIMHSLSWLATNGTASIVCFPGIFYRGGAEQKIRKYLIDNNFIDAVIQLPDNLFYGTSIATCILVLKKGKSDSNTLFIDASRECVKVTNSNKLTDENIEHIVGYYTAKKDVEYTAKLVSKEEIEANDYNLSVSSYVEAEDTREVIDIKVLNAQIAEIVAKENTLRSEIDEIIREYEYYRDALLTRETKVEVKKLGEVCLQTENVKWKTEKGEYQYIDLTSVDRETHSITETVKIDSSNAPSRAQQIVKENDVLFGTTRPMLKRTAFITKEFDNQICSTGYCVLRANSELVNPRYIYHQISTSSFYKYVDSHQQGASYPAISDSDVKKFPIPLPPLDVQQRIVNVLDNFDAICTDLKIGLPAEIEARKKQYEYYRDMLLSFDTIHTNGGGRAEAMK